MNDRVKKLLRSYMGYMAVFVVCAAYISTAFVTIDQSGKSVARIIADGTMSFLAGVLINNIFTTQGIMNGSKEPQVLATDKLHNETVTRIYPFMDRLEDWCDQKNVEALRRARTQYLSRVGMRYSDYFDKDGFPKDFIHKDPQKLREKWAEYIRYQRYRHAIGMKITRISAGILISDTGDADDTYFMGRSKPKYLNVTARADVRTKLLTATVFGYYSASLIADFSVAAVIWILLQVCFFIAMGVIKLQQSVVYVTDEYRGRMIKKIDVLEQFEISMKQEESNGKHKDQLPNPEYEQLGSARSVLSGNAEPTQSEPFAGAAEGERIVSDGAEVPADPK